MCPRKLTICWAISIPTWVWCRWDIRSAASITRIIRTLVPALGFAWDIGGNGRTVLRGGGGLIYETVNWQSFVAFNNAFGPGSVPTGAPIDAAGDTSGGTITTSNVTVKNFLNYPTTWDAANGPLYGGSTVNCSPVCQVAIQVARAPS